MKQGIAKGPQFRRIKIETVGLPFWRKVAAAFERPRIVLTDDYVVAIPGYGEILLPEGMSSDGGSVPMFLLWALAVVGSVLGGWWCVAAMSALMLGILLNPFGLMLIAFLVHDYAVQHGYVLMGDGRKRTVKNVWAANDLMRRVNFIVNDLIILDLVAHAAVTLGAWITWNKCRKQDGLDTIK